LADAGFLLDTNVLSEVSKPRPEARTMAWLAATDEARLFLSVATLAELNRGVEKLSAGTRQRRLAAWLSGELLHRFAARIIPVDAELALRNVSDFEAFGLPLLNPWSASPT